MELTARGKGLVEVEIQGVIFQSDVLLPFVIAIMLVSHIVRKCTSDEKLSKSQEKINHLIYMDDDKLFFLNKREMET